MTTMLLGRAVILGGCLLAAACASGGEDPAASAGTTGAGGVSASSGTSASSTGGGATAASSTASTGGGGSGGVGGGPVCSREKCGTVADENCDGENCSGDHVWSRRYGAAEGQQSSRGFGVDTQGRSTIIGTFTQSVDFGGGPPLLSDGTIDIFVAKVDASGDTLWSKAFGTDANQVPVGATSARGGSTVIYGNYSGTLDFGSGPITGNQSLFVVRLDTDGVASWSRSYGSGIGALHLDARIDKTDNVVVAAGYLGDADFGGGTITGTGDTFTLVKLDAAGNHVFSQKLPSAMTTTVALDDAGSIFLAGEGMQANVGCGLPVGTMRYVAKLDPGGACLWRKDVVSAAVDFIAADGGPLILAGRFNGNATIGGQAITSPTAKRFLLAFDAAGAFLWDFVFGDDTVHIAAIAADADGGVVAMGELASGTGDFDGQTVTGDTFLVRIDETGKWVWGRGFTGDVSFPAAVALDPANFVLLYGYATAPVDLGGGLLVGGAEPFGDVVLAKMKP